MLYKKAKSRHFRLRLNYNSLELFIIRIALSLTTVHMLAIVVLLALLTPCLSYDNGKKGSTPPMGWSTWCTNDLCGLRDICTEKEVKKRADAMVSEGMVEFGYNMIFLDDCWASKERDSEGKLQGDLDQFPQGMKALADYVHSKGLMLALYTCIGTQTCRKERPGSYGHFDLDAQTFADWGVDLVKVDACNKPGGETTQALYSDFSKALNNTGHEMIFAMCEWGDDSVWEWGGSISQMYRIAMDHLPFYRYGNKTAAGAGYGQGVKEVIDWMADLKPSKYNKPNAWMDPDFLMTRFPITMDQAESRTEFTFWVLWSSPLLVASDIVNMSSDKKAILMNKEVLDVHHDPLWISGERVWRNEDQTQAWSRPLANGDVAVVLYNAVAGESQTITILFADLGLDVSKQFVIRDLWAGRDVATLTGSYTADVGKHDVAFLRIRPATAV